VSRVRGGSGSGRGGDIRQLRAEHFGPVVLHRQSRYVEGLCEKCGGSIATNEEHEVRHWLRGPAEVCQHITCPVYAPSVRGWKNT
jgi:hypothetical protein